MVTIAGLLFAGLGFLSLREYQREKRRGVEYRSERDRNLNLVRPLVYGVIFMLIGTPLLLIGVVSGLVGFVRLLL